MTEPIGDTGWTLHTSEYSSPRITRDRPRDAADVDLDGDGLNVEHEVTLGWSGGTGDVRTSIPLPALLALLRANGYEVREPQS